MLSSRSSTLDRYIHITISSAQDKHTLRLSELSIMKCSRNFPHGILLALMLSTGDSFVPISNARIQSLIAMVGGRGWDNDDYLNGLSGDDEDRQKATEGYQEFSKSRKAFVDRQKEIMKTPEGRAFLDSRGGVPPGNSKMSVQRQEPVADVKPGTGGGSRMAQMMAQAEQMKKMRQMNPSMLGGFEQKLAVPLDDEEEEDEDTA